MPDPSVFAKASVNGIPLIVVVLGLVQWFKEQGVQAKYLKRVSLSVGLVLGAGYQLAVLPADATPATSQGWYAFVFGIVVYGLALGLVASGVYDAADTIFKKALGR